MAEGHRGRGRTDFRTHAFPPRVMLHSLLQEWVSHCYLYEHGRPSEEGDPQGSAGCDRKQPPAAKGPRNLSSSGLWCRIRKWAKICISKAMLSPIECLCLRNDNSPLVMCTDVIISWPYHVNFVLLDLWKACSTAWNIISSLLYLANFSSSSKAQLKWRALFWSLLCLLDELWALGDRDSVFLTVSALPLAQSSARLRISARGVDIHIKEGPYVSHCKMIKTIKAAHRATCLVFWRHAIAYSDWKPKLKKHATYFPLKENLSCCFMWMGKICSLNNLFWEWPMFQENFNGISSLWFHYLTLCKNDWKDKRCTWEKWFQISWR